MIDGDRVVVVECRSEIQAEVVVAHLAERGITGHLVPRGQTEILGGRRVAVAVDRNQLEQAREVVDALTGADRMAGLFDLRRLLPAVVFLVILVALISGLVNLLT